ncbi:MAG: hypothetical protein AAF290_08105 [Pseudomonadota bacterium]
MIARLTAYLALLLFIIGGPVLAALQGVDLNLLTESRMAPTYGTSEHSVIEWMQVAILLVIGLLCLLAIRYQPDHPGLAIVLLAIAGIALVRELDLFLDYYLIDHAWQLLVALIAVATGTYIMRRSRSLAVAMVRIQPSSSLALIIAAIALLLVYANILGHAPFWQSVLGADYSRTVKVAIEEFAELSGYWLWLVGQCEFLVHCRRSSSERPARDRRRQDRRKRG